MKAPTLRAFTLVELMIVLTILGVLAAILFPVLANVREKGRQTVCSDNLRQIGAAFHLYAQDYDGMLPYALDSSDVNVTTIWATQPKGCYAAVQEMKAAGQVLHYHHPPVGTGPMMPGVLDAYLSNPQVWHCPSDTGFDVLDNNDSCDGPCAMPSHPTMQESQGSSYLYHTSLGVALRRMDSLDGLTLDGKPVGPEGINLLFDGSGSWHGSPFALGRSSLRYTTLLADGHVKLLTEDDFNQTWYTSMKAKSVGPCP